MSFPEKVRNFWAEAYDNKCGFEFYDEKKGWQTCKKPLRQVHHIKPEGKTIHEGGNPDNNNGLGLCDAHHVRNTLSEEHSNDFAFHPDMGLAYKRYPAWKQRREHMQSIAERNVPKRDDPSPFDEMIQEHKKKAARGERYHAGTPEIDRYYEEKAQEKAWKKVVTTGQKKPESKRKVVKFKPTPTNWEWTRGLFDEKKKSS